MYTKVYLRTSKIRAFTPLICSTHLLIFPSVILSGFQLPLTTARFLLVWENQTKSHVFLHCAAAGSYLSWGSQGKVPGHPHSFSMQLSDIWDLHLLLRSFLQQGFSPYSFQVTSYSLKPLLLFDNSPPFFFLSFFLYFPESPITSFFILVYMQKHNACLASQLVVLSHASLLNGGLRKCCFCLVQLIPKFTTSLYQLQLACSRLPLENSEVQVGPSSSSSPATHTKLHVALQQLALNEYQEHVSATGINRTPQMEQVKKSHLDLKPLWMLDHHV